MRYSITYTVAATLVAGAAAHQHGHQQFHARREASPAEKRAPDAVTEYVAGPTETVYELNGKIVAGNDIQDAIANGEYVVIGESAPTFAPPAPATTSSSSAEIAAQFIEKSTTSSSSSAAPTTTSSSFSSAVASPTSSPSTGSGVSATFPDGQIACSEFPSDYGAVALDWLDLGGWSGLQFVPNYSDGDVSISDIITGIAGQSCSKGSMCSYACPAGYQKTQWPKAQGATKQSIGGLYCNTDGFLELTRKEYDTLCEAGVGGVSIQNDLDEEVSTCRTDYPGTESMVVPAVASPGGTVDLCNPDQDSYYTWDGLATSAQYYINPKGVSKEDACVWNSLLNPESAGNWAPLIADVGYTSDGTTFLSIFQNLPTSNAQLDFNVEITGDVSTKCSYIDGQWTGGSAGCTTAMSKGGKAVFRYF